LIENIDRLHDSGHLKAVIFSNGGSSNIHGVSGIKLTTSGMDYLEELKSKTMKAQVVKWVWRVVCFVGGAIAIKLIEKAFD